MKRSKNKRKLLLIISIITFQFFLLVVLVGCSCQPENSSKPWYQDSVNLTYILEDNRSEEKSISFTVNSGYFENRVFNYTMIRGNNTKAYIPKLVILYKSIEQNIFTKINRIESFVFDENGPDYSRPEITNNVLLPGYYRVTLFAFLTEEDKERFNNPIMSVVIYINVKQGEVQ